MCHNRVHPPGVQEVPAPATWLVPGTLAQQRSSVRMDEGGSTRCINPEGLAVYAEINKRLDEKSGSAFLLGLDELLCVLFGEARKHEPEHREIDHGLRARREVLIILAHTAVAANPGKGTLHHPAPRQGVKGLAHRHPPHPPTFPPDPPPPPTTPPPPIP